MTGEHPSEQWPKPPFERVDEDVKVTDSFTQRTVLHVLLCCLPHQRWKETKADITFGGQAAKKGKYQT